MAYGIYSEDFLAICLYLVKGDISVPLSQLVETVESFQRENDSQYGICDTDFRFVLIQLCQEHHLVKDTTYKTDSPRILEGITIKEIVVPVLAKLYAYFNDSDECWVPFVQGSRRLEAYYELSQFFSSSLNKEPEEILMFLKNSSISPSITLECLEKGNYKDMTWNSDSYWDDF